MTDEEIVEKSEETATPPRPVVVSAEAETAQMGRNEPLAQESEPLPMPTPLPTPAPQTAVMNAVRDILAKASAMIQTKKRKKLDLIMKFLEEKHRITNDDVEKLLHVSDATATRYLTDLVKSGKIHRSGTEGAAVYYTKI